MRRKLSYNVSTILTGFLFLFSITYTLYVIQRILPYVEGDFNLSILIITVGLALFLMGLAGFKIIMRFIKGDVGEMVIENILAKFPNDYLYLRDLVIEKKGNIDSVVIGPTGVWTIEVKNQSEKVIIHDKYLNKDLAQSYAEKMVVQKVLDQNGMPTAVTPVLVLANPKTKLNFGMVPQKGVYVIGTKWLEELLTKHSKGYLSPEHCQQIKQILTPFTSKIN
jgi:hypothetical protein